MNIRRAVWPTKQEFSETYTSRFRGGEAEEIATAMGLTLRRMIGVLTVGIVLGVGGAVAVTAEDAFADAPHGSHEPAAGKTAPVLYPGPESLTPPR